MFGKVLIDIYLSAKSDSAMIQHAEAWIGSQIIMGIQEVFPQ